MTQCSYADCMNVRQGQIIEFAKKIKSFKNKEVVLTLFTSRG